MIEERVCECERKREREREERVSARDYESTVRELCTAKELASSKE